MFLSMDAVLHKLDLKLQHCSPDLANEIRSWLAEIIELSDADALDLIRSRQIEQDVLNLIDEPSTW
jgi:hypothetical protein